MPKGPPGLTLARTNRQTGFKMARHYGRQHLEAPTLNRPDICISKAEADVTQEASAIPIQSQSIIPIQVFVTRSDISVSKSSYACMIPSTSNWLILEHVTPHSSLRPTEKPNKPETERLIHLYLSFTDLFNADSQSNQLQR
jgi:hypothetical protein